MKVKIILRAAALFAVISALLCSCSSSSVPNKVFSPEDIGGKTVGVIAGTVAESFLSGAENVNVRAFSNSDELMAELLRGSLDAVVCDSSVTEELLKTRGVTSLSEPFYEGDYRIAVSQENETLLKNVNSALSELRQSGELGRLGDMDGDISLGGEETLTIAVCPDFYPYAYIDEEGEVRGTEVTLARLICRNLGVNAELRQVESDKLIYMVESGKVSLAIGRIAQGRYAVNYSDGYGSVREDIIVRK